MPTQSFKTTVKKAIAASGKDKTMADAERYWADATKTVKKRAEKGDPVKDPNEYKEAVVLRRLGNTPHKSHKNYYPAEPRRGKKRNYPKGGPRPKKAKSEAFEMKVDAILENSV